ncbi:T9SS_type A sorting domain-containing protein [Hexamita inflata]|uniref:T9SS type A sorting domain-containing protein n=1 Tax=Hexamita inflata TaxID=28002 RepID=A0AA86TMY7_9EUKA|nr:T9SS type A sorting domain-containing protein [Hexamita inflata]
MFCFQQMQMIFFEEFEKQSNFKTVSKDSNPEPTQYYQDFLLNDIDNFNQDQFNEIENQQEKQTEFDFLDLQTLVNLQQLSITNNISVTNTQVLKRMTQLTQLNLTNNNLTNISVLQYLTNLQDLNISHNPGIKISPIQHLIKLCKLNISNNQLDNFNALVSLVNLKVFDVSNNIDCDIAPINNYSKLTSLNISCIMPSRSIQTHKFVIDIQNMSLKHQLDCVQTLNISQNKFSDVTFLQYLKSLQELDLSHNSCVDISPLQYLVNIRSLRLDNNQITEISPLRQLVRLQYLDIKCNYVAFVYPLQDLQELEQFFMEENIIRDINNVKNVRWISTQFVATQEQITLSNRMRDIDITSTTLRKILINDNLNVQTLEQYNNDEFSQM